APQVSFDSNRSTRPSFRNGQSFFRFRHKNYGEIENTFHPQKYLLTESKPEPAFPEKPRGNNTYAHKMQPGPNHILTNVFGPARFPSKNPFACGSYNQCRRCFANGGLRQHRSSVFRIVLCTFFYAFCKFRINYLCPSTK